MLTVYESPLGRLTIDEHAGVLRGLWMEGQANLPADVLSASEPAKGPVADWLDAYFTGENPELTFALEPTGTAFQQDVWSALRDIPYGQTVSYGELATIVGRKRGTPPASRAVGGAVGKNQIMIVIPCHRVIGADGKITGYSAGTERKIWLLEHEAMTR